MLLNRGGRIGVGLGAPIAVRYMAIQSYRLAHNGAGPITRDALPLQSPLHTKRSGSWTSLSASPSAKPTSKITRRQIHQSSRRTTTLTTSPSPIHDPLNPRPQGPTDPITRAPLSVLPLNMILRSLLTTTISSSPLLLPPSLHLMSILAHSHLALLDPDRNPVLKYILKQSFYAQFCAGENGKEVKRKIEKLKNIGFTGVMMSYAREVVLTAEQSRSLGQGKAGAETPEAIEKEIKPWAEGTMNTVKLLQAGDFVALKFSGAGSTALLQLRNQLQASPYLAQSIDKICALAHERGVGLLFDAEQDALQDGIDAWTLQYAKKYNTNPDAATIYGTYQAYKKSTPANLSSHLNVARREGFTLGVKLVRGAYLGSDPREVFHDTKEDTDICFNNLAASVLTRQWTSSVVGGGAYPNVHLVVATHNAESVSRARAICDSGDARSNIAFAQLLGMADEVSCELVEASISRQAKAAEANARGEEKEIVELPVYKYLVWGSTGECMKYLLRRAQENKDAVMRTRDERNAMWAELVRRTKTAVGLA